MVRQFDASDGKLNWEFPCSMVTGDDNCDLSVQADFRYVLLHGDAAMLCMSSTLTSATCSMARSGNRLYYSFTNGTMVALTVGNFPTEAPTTAPSAKPNPQPVSQRQPSSGARPTAAPSLRGTPLNHTSGTSGDSSQDSNGNSTAATQQQPSSNAASALSLPVILGAAAGGLVLLILVLFCCTYCKKKRISKDEQERVKQELDAVRKWNQEKEAYEKDCKEQEQQTLKEIVGPSKPIPTTPPKGSPSGSKTNSISANLQKSTPLTLDSITEDADFDDGSEGGVEISLSDKSEVLTIDAIEVGNQAEPTRQIDPVGLLGPLDPHVESDRASTDLCAQNTDIEPLVRNLSETFTSQAETVAAQELSSVHLDPPIRNKPRDPEPTGVLPRDCSGTSAQAELVLAVREGRKAKVMDSSVVSASSTDAGLIPIVYRAEDDIVPVHKPGKSASEGFLDYRGRPTSPDFSDIWSVDDSLYIDEESKTGRERWVHQVEPSVSKAEVIEEGPDDEPGKISKGIRPKSPPVVRPTSPLVKPKSSLSPLNSPLNPANAPQLSLPKPIKSIKSPASLTLHSEPPALRSASPPMRAKSPCLHSSSPVSRLNTLPKPDPSDRSRSLSSLPPNPVVSKPETIESSARPPTLSYEPKPSDTNIDRSVAQLHDRPLPQARGGSARPKAGLFTRLDNSITSTEESDSTGAVAPALPPVGYLQEREDRATYTPSQAPMPGTEESGNRSVGSSLASSRQTTRASNQRSSPSRAQDVASSVRPSSRRVRKPAESLHRQSQPAPKPAPKASSSSGSKANSTWDSFLTELAKVCNASVESKTRNIISAPVPHHR